jgi:hypothetical protein
MRLSTSSPSLRAPASLVATLLALIACAQAQAALLPAQAIYGPDSTILDVDGSAIAPDGTGAVLYRKLIGGQPHLFVSRFQAGAFLPSVQVDAGQPFGASFPAIAAGNNGRLLVVWAEPWATIGQTTHFRLMSSGIDPGGAQFDPAIPIDDLGDGSAAYPSLAMAPNGIAYVAYRVVTNPLTGPGTTLPLRAGDELIDVRVARYNGEGLPWSVLGAINNHPELTMRHPRAENAPSIALGLTGNAVVAWQEPDTSGTARIWLRRIFGTRLGNVLAVTPSEVGGRPITVDADAPSVATETFGGAMIAYRLASGAGSPYGSARVFIDTLPPETDPHGGRLEGAHAVGGATVLGAPSVSNDAQGAYRVSYVGSAVATASTGDLPKDFGSPRPLGSARGTRAPTTISPGGGVTAWATTSTGGAPIVEAREDFSGGGWQLAQLSAPLGGPTSEPMLAGAEGGDAIIAFSQGPAGRQSVMAAVAKAPPGGFIAYAPSSWVRGRSASVSWDSSPEAFGATSYQLLVDGQIRARGLTGQSAKINPQSLGDGVHRVQVIATDGLGQRTMTPITTLKVDANPPQVSVTVIHPHGTVRVRVYDRASGAVSRVTSVDFGDGARVDRRLTTRHRYAHPGRYTILVRSSDRVGNHLLAHISVEVG